MSMMQLLVQRLSPDAKLPTRGSQKAAGLDLYASEDVDVLPGCRKLVSTSLAIRICEGHYGRIAPRSGSAVQNGISVGAGVIDEDYRGEIKVLLFNHGHEIHKVNKGDRVAQLIHEKISYPDVQEVDSLDKTDRGHLGFGSTGL